MNWLNDRRYALQRAAAMIVDRPVAFFITALLTACALALPLFVGVLGYSALPWAPRLQRAAGPEASIFVALGTAPRDLDALQAAAGRMPGVTGVRLIPKDQALEDLAKRSGISFGGGDRTNPLPDVLIVRFKPGLDSAAIDRALEAIRALPGADRVRADIDWYRRSRSLVLAIVAIVTVLTSFVAGLVFLVLVAAAREQTTLRRDEMAVMGLCGATPAFMARPTAYLSAFSMGIGALVAAAAVLGAVAWIRPTIIALGQVIGQSVELRLPPVWTVTAMLAAAVALGAAAGWVGARRAAKTAT